MVDFRKSQFWNFDVEKAMDGVFNKLLVKIAPGLTVSQVKKMIPIREGGARERWLEALRTAGLPK